MKVFRVKRRCKPAGKLAAVSQNDTRPVILAVDDAEDLLALIGKALSAEYQVKLATDGGALVHSVVPHRETLEDLFVRKATEGHRDS